MAPMILRSITVNKEEAAILRAALPALIERGLLSVEGHQVAASLTVKVQAALDSIFAAEATQTPRQDELSGENAGNGSSILPSQSRVWTYRSSSWSAQDEDEARRMITHEAERAIPAEQATITLMSMRKTPTGRWSAMVRRERID